MANYRKKITKKSEKLLIKSFIKLLKQSISEKSKLNNRFSLVLTGGSSPINLYKGLSQSNINWANVDFFIGDERFVSSKSDFSNFKLVNNNLLKKIHVNKKQIYLINANKKKISQSTQDYKNKIIKYFKDKEINFDLTLLGMGNDGHIASLFSRDKKIFSAELVRSIKRIDFNRITIGLNVINKSKKIVLWLPNKKKFNYFNSLKTKTIKPVKLLKKNKLYLFNCN